MPTENTTCEVCGKPLCYLARCGEPCEGACREMQPKLCHGHDTPTEPRKFSAKDTLEAAKKVAPIVRRARHIENGCEGCDDCTPAEPRCEKCGGTGTTCCTRTANGMTTISMEHNCSMFPCPDCTPAEQEWEKELKKYEREDSYGSYWYMGSVNLYDFIRKVVAKARTEERERMRERVEKKLRDKYVGSLSDDHKEALTAITDEDV